ncbi:MAG: hypothetical protein IJ869_07230 [Clostridiales bacterium]|nr:hypothetical protein [Clostridiales bacterium]
MYRKYHAHQLAWFRSKLESSPKIYIGKDRVYVIKGGKRSRYRRLSKNGKYWSLAADVRLEDEKAYRELEAEWRKSYKDEPPEIPIPVKSGNRMDSAFFDRQKACCNKVPILHPTEYKGVIYRSKNEQMTAMVLDAMGLEFKYETQVDLGGGMVFHPDFLVNARAIDRCFYLEVFGDPDNKGYADTARFKISNYNRIGVFEWDELLPVYAPTSHSFDSVKLRILVELMLESLSPGIE